MKVYALVAPNPDRVIKTYRNLGAAKGARTQMRWPALKVVVFESFEVVA